MNIYYDINEENARHAKESYSFSDYVKGSETASYQREVDEIYAIAESVKPFVTEERLAKADYLADLFAKKYAEWINKKNRISMFCPSMMITGGSNFPVRRKEKQNNMMGKHWTEYEYIMKIKEDIAYLKIAENRQAKQGTATAETFDNPFFEVVQNEEDNRLQLIFEGKPDEATRNLLKHNGYKWSGKNVCWQRQLTVNARHSVRYLITELSKATN